MRATSSELTTNKIYGLRYENRYDMPIKKLRQMVETPRVPYEGSLEETFTPIRSQTVSLSMEKSYNAFETYCSPLRIDDNDM